MTLAPPAGEPLNVPRWDTEIPLLVLVAMFAFALWVAIFVSIVGIFYAVFFAVFFFLAQLAFIAHLRGSSVKLGPDQMPELYARVQSIAARFGMKQPPDAYVMQAGGALNALATKLFRTNFIVLFSELLEACEDDDRAADFIIAHEIGHLQAGHLRFQWFLAPGRLVPFIGSAYSRAREYTADRYGAAISTDASAAVRGLTILAAGPLHAKRVNHAAMMRQRKDMNTVWMTLGSWLSTHPPIVHRIAELDRALGGEKIVAGPAVVGALAVIVLAFMVPAAGGSFAMFKFIRKMDEMTKLAQQRTAAASAVPAPQKVEVVDVPAAVETAQREMKQLAAVADAYHAKTGSYPADEDALYALWRAEHPDNPELFDPFDGEHYGYALSGTGYTIYSAGASRDGVDAASMRITR